jgi:hypothetical protein
VGPAFGGVQGAFGSQQEYLETVQTCHEAGFEHNVDLELDNDDEPISSDLNVNRPEMSGELKRWGRCGGRSTRDLGG